MSRHPTGADMTPPIENVPTWLVDSGVVTIIDIKLPPRDPSDDDNEDDEDDEDDENDENDEDDEPAVVREPDPDEWRRIAASAPAFAAEHREGAWQRSAPFLQRRQL